MARRVGEWVSHGERTVWSGDWVDLAVADVSSPVGRRLAYDVVRARYHGAACLVANHSDQVLLIWRHRFIPNRWGWELPAGGVGPEEDVVEAAAREVREECGWSVYDARRIWSLSRCPERSDHVGHLVWARAGERVGPPDPEEVVQIGWFERNELRRLLADSVHDVFTVAALLWWLTWG